MKKILLLFIMLAPLCLLATGTNVPPGPVSGIWSHEGSPYYVEGTIFVEETETLVIKAGVEVRFTGWYKFIVYGSLIAEGEEELYIRITSDDPGEYSWQGIRFMQNTVSSVMDHCIIEYGETVLDPSSIPDNGGGGIQILYSFDKVTIKNCIIRNNEACFGGGIQILYASPLIENCQIHHNTAVKGGGIDGWAAGNPVISGCRISSNTAENGGGISMQTCYPYLKSNNILSNIATSLGGGLYFKNVIQYTMERNIVAHNTAVIGGAVYLNNANGDLKVNTYAYNNALNYGGAFYMYKANPLHRSDLIYFNEALIDGQQVYLASNSSDPDFVHCNILDGVLGFSGTGAGANFGGLWEYCIDGNPLFEDPFNNNFSITWENYPYVDLTRSPCIDAGCPGIFVEPDGTCCDIGANCYLQIIDVPGGLESYSTPGSMTYFVAGWEPAYGALGYFLEVAGDKTFSKIVFDTAVTGTLCLCPVMLPEPMESCYFRVRGYNTAVTGSNSNPYLVLLNPTRVDENLQDDINIYTNAFGIHIEIDQEAQNTGDIWVYNMSGQLLLSQSLMPGYNTLPYFGAEQILIVKVNLNGKTYQQKLLMH